jgi:hypothetical protein
MTLEAARVLLADLAATLLMVLLFIGFGLATVLLFLVWRGLDRFGERLPGYAVLVETHLRRVEATSRAMSQAVIDPQIRLASGWAGVKAGIRSLIAR